MEPAGQRQIPAIRSPGFCFALPDEKPDGDLHRPGFFPIFDVPYRRVPRSPYLYENRTNENRAVCRTARLARRAGLYVILFRPGVSLLTPRMLIPSMLCINLLAILLRWRRLGWSRNERLDAAMLLVMFALFPWLEYRVLPVGAFEENLWAQVGCYCAGQAIGYVSVVLVPDWLGRLRQRRYEERVLSGREKFRSRKEVLEQRAEAQEAQRRAKELRRAKK